MFKILRFLRSSKCSKTTVELTFTTQKANACSPWTGCSVFGWKYHFWVNLVQKIKNCLFKLKFGTWTNSNMQNYLVMFTFPFSTGNNFFGKFGQKNENCPFDQKIGTKTNLNMQNSMVVYTFSVLNQKNPFWANVVQKIKIASLSWNLVPRLIRICRIQWWCSLFLFLTINILLRQIWSKNSKLFVQSKIWYKDKFEYAEFNGCVHFICFRLEIAIVFGQIWSKKSKLSV